MYKQELICHKIQLTNYQMTTFFKIHENFSNETRVMN